MRPSWRTWQGGVTSLLLQIEAPGQSGLGYGAEALVAALKGVFLNACSHRARCAREHHGCRRQPDRDLARGGHRARTSGAAPSTTTRSACWPAPARSTIRRIASCEIAAKFAADCRTMTHVTALLADGRPYHEAGASEAQELAAMLATLVAYLRACEAAGLRPRAAFDKIALALGGRCRPVPDDRQAARRAQLLARVAEACGAAQRRRRAAHHRHHLASA